MDYCGDDWDCDEKWDLDWDQMLDDIEDKFDQWTNEMHEEDEDEKHPEMKIQL